MCGCDSADEPRVFERTLRKARRGYACGECARRIQHGDWYEDARGLWEGGWETFQTCFRCAARREAWARIECRPAFTQLTESIRGCLVAFDYDRGLGRGRRCIDHAAGRDYIRALKTARDKLRAGISLLETQRAERYRLAGVARQQQRRARREMGARI